MKIPPEMSADVVVRSLGIQLGVALFRSSEQSILYANDAAVEMFKYSLDEFQQFSLPSLLASNSEKEEILTLVSLRGSLYNQRILFQRKDSTTFWGLLNCTMVAGRAGMYFDVSI